MKRSILLICLALIALAWFSIPVRAAQNSPVTLSVDAGYGSYFRGQHWTPLRISVSNNGPDIRGELRVTAAGSPGLTTGAYATEIDLPNGSSKQIFLYVTLGDGSPSVKVELATANGIVTDVTKSLRTLSAPDLLYVVVTDSPRSAIDLQDVRPGAGIAQQVYWHIENLPENPQALDSINVLLLSDVDTGNFSTNQQRAIADWVRSGGHLVVTGGPNWQKTQAGVTDLLPLKPERTTTLTSLPSIATYAGTLNEKLDAPANSPIIIATGQVTNDARVVVEESGVTLLARHNFGEGIVDYLAIDPSTEPFQSWGSRGNFWFMLLTTTGQQPSWTNGIVKPESAQMAANFIKGVRLPDVFQLCGFLLVYIILIGPLNYLLLKRIGRREWAWVTIPIIIFACSIVAYLTGFSLRGTQATINRISMVQVWPNSNRAELEGVVGVLAPRRSLYSVGMQDNVTMRTITSDVDTDFGTKIWEYPNYEARDVPVDAGITAVFGTSGYIEAAPMQGNAEIILPSQLSNSRSLATYARITGAVTNTTGMTLEDVVVLAMGARYQLDTLDPNETAKFDVTLSPTNYLPPSITLGSSPNYNSSGYYSSSGYYYGPQDITVQDIMGGAFQSYLSGFGYGDNPTQQEYRRRQAFLSAVISDIDPAGGRGDKVYVVGWTTSSPVNVSLQGAAHVTEDTTMYIYELPATVQPTNDDVNIPIPFMTWMTTPSSTLQGVAPYGLNIAPRDKAVFRFIPLPSVRLQEVTELQILLTTQSYGQGVISLWDWQEQQWVDVNAQRPLNTISDPQRFIGPENVIEMQIQTAQGSASAAYDNISISLSGKLGTTANS